MKPKTTVKMKREKQEIEKLKRRLTDIAFGAYGPYVPVDFEDENFGEMAGELGTEAFARWLGGIANTLLVSHDDSKRRLIEVIYLDNYTTIQKAAEFLYRHQIRA